MITSPLSWAFAAILAVFSLALGCADRSDATPPADPSAPSPAQESRSLPADSVRIELIEKIGDRGYRWRVQIGADIRAISYGVRGAGEASGVSGASSGDRPSELEIVYVERQVDGKAIVEAVELLGDEAAKRALLEAAPDFEGHQLSRFELSVGGTTMEGVVPKSVIRHEPETVYRGYLGASSPTSARAGEPITLARTIAVHGGAAKGGSSSVLIGGTHQIKVGGEMVDFDEALQSGKHPGWTVWVRFDTSK